MTKSSNHFSGDGTNSDFAEARSMRRVSFGLAFLAALTTVAFAGCDGTPPVNQVGVNIVDKDIFEGSWYVGRTVVDVDYEAAGAGTFPGDTAYDHATQLAGFSIPRIRWVIDEDFLYAYRDYELIAGIDGEEIEAGEKIGHPVAAYAIESHFDIERAYNSVTGEERNTLIEDTLDRRWYERDYMRVDWSKNLLPGYYGQFYQLYEILGLWNREPTDLYVQSLSEFPDSWRPQFHYMPCNGPEDTSEACTPEHRDFADDYAQGELYHMSFVGQELLSPGMVPDPFTGAPVNWCTSIYADRPTCTTNAIYVRTSFLKVSDDRQYERINWTDTRFERAGYFRLQQPTYDRSLAADDPAYGAHRLQELRRAPPQPLDAVAGRRGEPHPLQRARAPADRLVLEPRAPRTPRRAELPPRRRVERRPDVLGPQPPRRAGRGLPPGRLPDGRPG